MFRQYQHCHFIAIIFKHNHTILYEAIFIAIFSAVFYIFLNFLLNIHRSTFFPSFSILLRSHPSANCLSIYLDRVNCRSIFYDALAAMTTDWREATVSEMHIMTSKANLSRRFSNVIIGIHSVAVFCFGIEVLASHTDDYDADGIETPVRAFTLKLQLPLQCNESPLYELIMCLEFFHQLASSTVTGILNSLLITLVSVICEKKILNIFRLQLQ